MIRMNSINNILNNPKLGRDIKYYCRFIKLESKNLGLNISFNIPLKDNLTYYVLNLMKCDDLKKIKLYSHMIWFITEIQDILSL